MLVGVLALLGCAPRVVLTPAPAGAPDGAVMPFDGPATFAVVGDLDDAAPVVSDLVSRMPAITVLTGDAIRRGTPRAWSELQAAFDPLSTVVLPGDGERRRDPQLATYSAAWSGLGVRGVEDDPVPWRSIDVVSAGVRWRLVFADADERALSGRWRDQLFWLPKAIGGDYDRLILITNHPPVSLAAGFSRRDGVTEILELVRAHAPPTALVAWMAGEGAAELLVPTGRWNEAVVVAGCSSRSRARTLRREDGDLSLPGGLQDALLVEFEAWRAQGAHDTAALDDGAPYGPPKFPVCGWWEARIDGDSLAVSLRMEGFRAPWSAVWTARWTPDTGWVTEPP